RSGGIGRRARFRTWFPLREWRFESSLRHLENLCKKVLPPIRQFRPTWSFQPNAKILRVGLIMTSNRSAAASVLRVSLLFAATAFTTSCAPAADEPDVQGIVQAIKVLPDKAPDCSSLKAIVESVTRGCKTNDDKAIAIYNFMRLTHYH